MQVPRSLHEQVRRLRRWRRNSQTLISSLELRERRWRTCARDCAVNAQRHLRYSTDAVVADMADEGAANTVAQTKCTPPVTPRTTNGAAAIFSSTRQDVRPPARDCCTWYSFRSRMTYTFLVSSRGNRKPHSEPRRNLC